MKWFPDWSNDVVAVVASGPSAKTSGVEALRGRARTIAINRTIELIPWADVWYACDPGFWRTYANLLEGYRGISVGVEGHILPWDVRKVRVPDARTQWAQRAWMLMDPKGTIGTGGNSGFQGINLAAQFGARRIILVGFDMHLNDGSHWHGDHINGLRNPETDLIEKWRRVLDAQANTLREYGIDVVNVSPGSALREYRKTTIEEALHQWTSHPITKPSTLAAE